MSIARSVLVLLIGVVLLSFPLSTAGSQACHGWTEADMVKTFNNGNHSMAIAYALAAIRNQPWSGMAASVLGLTSQSTDWFRTMWVGRLTTIVAALVFLIAVASIVPGVFRRIRWAIVVSVLVFLALRFTLLTQDLTVVQQDAQLRVLPDTESNSIGVAQAGWVGNVEEISDQYYLVAFSGMTGWIHADGLLLVTDLQACQQATASD